MSEIVKHVHIAILLTCFNRKQKTLLCLQNLDMQSLPQGVQLEIFLVDDGSTDGTSDAVSKNHPDVNLIRSEDNLYWNQGMCLAWKSAMKRQNYDYYLLLNDDTELFMDAIAKLLGVENSIKCETGNTGVIVGSTMDSVTKRLTYGGNNRLRGFLGKGFRFGRVTPMDKPVICDTFNANCVLISQQVVDDIGILSDRFTHGFGDYDYGLRAKEKGYLCWVAPCYVGTCSINDEANTWLDPSVPFAQRDKLQKIPKGIPTAEWLYFVKRHAGYMWILAWLQLNLRLYFPRAWTFLKMLRSSSE